MCNKSLSDDWEPPLILAVEAVEKVKLPGHRPGLPGKEISF